MAAQIGTSAAAARAHEEMYSYWAGLRRGARLPGRGDVDPAALKRLLPTVSLIDVRREPLDFRVRLAGTGLYSVYGREITGRMLGDIYQGPAGEYWRKELDKVVDERRPGVGVHSLAWRGAPHMSILWLRLPLAGADGRINQVLCHDEELASRRLLTPPGGAAIHQKSNLHAA